MTSRMSLANVTTAAQNPPLRVLIYGTEGIGKTTFGADADAPVFVGTEDGTAHIAGVARFPKPETWEDMLEALHELATGTHTYRTVVLDSLDWAEPLCFAYVCRKFRATSIEAVGGGYGKGYTAALDEWRVFLAALDTLRAKRGMEVILIAHSTLKNTKNPEGEDYERYQLAINAKAADAIKQWADVVLFARYKTFTIEQNGRTKGIDGAGARVVQTERRAAYDAKNRYGIKAELPLDYAAVKQAIREGANAEEFRGRITAALEGVRSEAFREKVRIGLEAAGNDCVKLGKIESAIVLQAAQESAVATKEAS